MLYHLLLVQWFRAMQVNNNVLRIANTGKNREMVQPVACITIQGNQGNDLY